MPADYQVIDANGALVWTSTSYNRYFWVTQKGSPLLLLWVKTGYTSYTNQAIVRINGKEVGRIPPRPWGTHGILDYEVVAMPFSSSVLDAGPVWLGMLNTLSIVATGSGGSDYVLVDEMVLMTRS